MPEPCQTAFRECVACENDVSDGAVKSLLDFGSLSRSIISQPIWSHRCLAIDGQDALIELMGTTEKDQHTENVRVGGVGYLSSMYAQTAQRCWAIMERLERLQWMLRSAVVLSRTTSRTICVSV